MSLFRSLVVLVPLTLSAGAQQIIAVPGEPRNIDAVKQQLVHYHDCSESDCYLPQLERQDKTALNLLQQSIAAARPGDKLALVLDIDETSLSNWSVETHDDFAYIPADFDFCVQLHCSRVIAPTLQLFHAAQKDHVAVFFITGRPEHQRANTEANLREQGYDGWQHLYLRPDDHAAGQTTVDYKSAMRRLIVQQGYRIVLSVGDQRSDLTGDPQADHSVKLPNPFYFIP